MQNGNNMNINFHGNLSETQVQVGTINSTQTTINGEQFPYEEILKILKEIEKHKEELAADFGKSETEFCNILSEAINETESRQNPSKIKRVLKLLKELAVGISGSLIASGVVAMLEKISM